MPSPLSVGSSQTRVFVKLVNGEELDGMMYLSQGNRLLDHMNDSRSFLPLDISDHNEGQMRKVLMINKSSILHIQEVKNKG